MSSPLEHAAEVMDRLRSPGGCPWDAAQSHESLTPYLLEETYEVLDAIESDDHALLREELGDLLLQVLFHARLAQELPPGEAFGIDEVADDLVAKLVRRHPHVFAAAAPAGETLEALNDVWERRKVEEKGRTSVVDGIPPTLPALAMAAKLLGRARRAGLDGAGPPVDADSAEDDIGARLFALVREAEDGGVDAESALRRVVRRYRAGLIAAESAAKESPTGSTGGATGRN